MYLVQDFKIISMIKTLIKISKSCIYINDQKLHKSINTCGVRVRVLMRVRVRVWARVSGTQMLPEVIIPCGPSRGKKLIHYNSNIIKGVFTLSHLTILNTTQYWI